MANSNQGIGGFLPFPTFGGGEGGGGVTPVKMPASQMRFPTARAPASRRSVKPTVKETLSPFLPLALEGIMGMLSDKPQPMSDAEFLDSKNLNILENPTTLKEVKSNEKALAQLSAYNLFGEREEQEGFGLSDIAQMVVGSQMGRGAGDYASTYLGLRKAKETARLNKNANRTAYMTKALDEVDNLQFKNFEDTESARAGVNDYRTGFVDPRGEIYVMADTRKGYVNVKSLEGNWIEQKYKPTADLASQMKDPRLTELQKHQADLSAKDNALIGTVTLTNGMVKMLDKGIKDPSQNPLTLVTNIGNFLNTAKSNAEGALSYIGEGTVANAFASRGSIGGSIGREGDGELAGMLYNAVQSGDDEQMKIAMEAFENGNDGVSFRASLGDMAYNDVRTRATMLQLAYAAAAANGQTGRTLSDKDLAFHLQMVGFGATQDAQTAKDNILSFIDTLVRQTDNVVMGTISKNSLNAGQYPLDDNLFTSIIGGYWEPSVVDGKRDYTNPQKYVFKNFYTRYGEIPDIELYQKHKRRAGTEFDSSGATTAVSPSARLNEDLQAIEDLYK
tara:strand:+ start:389 stop:2071 length:1683 start_codon:yes stop_codon:yes gene_type:complete